MLICLYFLVRKLANTLANSAVLVLGISTAISTIIVTSSIVISIIAISIPFVIRFRAPTLLASAFSAVLVLGILATVPTIEITSSIVVTIIAISITFVVGLSTSTAKSPIVTIARFHLLLDPTQVPGYIGIDTWFVSSRTTNAKTDDTSNDWGTIFQAHKRTSGVSLTGILTAMFVTSTNHVTSDTIVVTVIVVASVLIDDGYGYPLQNCR